MRKSSSLVILGILMMIIGVSNYSFGDKRSYVWTYEYLVMPRGEFEFEYYLTLALPDKDKSDINIWKYYLEFEHGIADNMDIALYQVFKQTNGQNGSHYQYSGFKVRLRYRIGEKGKFFIDPLLYFEYIQESNFSKPGKFEGKVILAKDIGRFNFAYNHTIEREFGSSGETEYEYALGLSYEISPLLRLGLESKGNYSEGKYAWGPTISHGGRLWVSFGLLFALNGRTDDIQARVIVGVPL
jgi:hypothetical protein